MGQTPRAPHWRTTTPSLRYWRLGWLGRSIFYGLPCWLEDLVEGQRNRSDYWRSGRAGQGSAPRWLRRITQAVDWVAWMPWRLVWSLRPARSAR